MEDGEPEVGIWIGCEREGNGQCGRTVGDDGRAMRWELPSSIWIREREAEAMWIWIWMGVGVVLLNYGYLS